jgi:2-C-methyl-D-erythritol 4-phosphate cytidylyltransferase
MVHVVWGLVIASGKSEQMGSNGIDTAFLNLGGKPILYYSLYALEKCPDINGIAVVARKERLQEIQQMSQLFGFSKLRKIAAGTTQRTSCVKAGLNVLDESVTIVTIQDVSRPLVDQQTISDSVKTAKRYGCAVAAAKTQGAARVAQKGYAVDSTLDAGTVWDSQSPISCRLDLLNDALDKASSKKFTYQDEAHLVEQNGQEVRVVPSPIMNMKVAEVEDLAMAEALLKLNAQ